MKFLTFSFLLWCNITTSQPIDTFSTTNYVTKYNLENLMQKYYIGIDSVKIIDRELKLPPEVLSIIKNKKISFIADEDCNSKALLVKYDKFANQFHFYTFQNKLLAGYYFIYSGKTKSIRCEQLFAANHLINRTCFYPNGEVETKIIDANSLFGYRITYLFTNKRHKIRNIFVTKGDTTYYSAIYYNSGQIRLKGYRMDNKWCFTKYSRSGKITEQKEIDQ